MELYMYNDGDNRPHYRFHLYVLTLLLHLNTVQFPLFKDKTGIKLSLK